MARLLRVVGVVGLGALVSGCKASEDSMLTELVRACEQADRSSPWVASVEHSERVSVGADVERETAVGPVRAQDVEAHGYDIDWEGVVVLDLVEEFGPGESVATGAVELQGLVPDGRNAEVDGRLAYDHAHAHDGDGMAPTEDGELAYVPPDWSLRETRIAGTLEFTGRWEGARRVDLTLTTEKVDGGTSMELVGEFDGRAVERSW